MYESNKRRWKTRDRYITHTRGFLAPVDYKECIKSSINEVVKYYCEELDKKNEIIKQLDQELCAKKEVEKKLQSANKENNILRELIKIYL